MSCNMEKGTAVWVSAWQCPVSPGRAWALAQQQGGLGVLPPSSSKGGYKRGTTAHQTRKEMLINPGGSFNWDMKTSSLPLPRVQLTTMRQPLSSRPGREGRAGAVVLQGEDRGNTQHLSLTEPARGCHTDVQGHIRGNIYLAASGLTCGGASECQVQVVRGMAIPTGLGEELEDVHACVPGTTAVPACFQTVCSVILCALMLGSLHKQACCWCSSSSGLQLSCLWLLCLQK